MDISINITRDDINGNRSIISTVPPGGIFAEALCCAGVSESPVTVSAGADSVIMRIAFKRILHVCPNSCSFHTRLIGNMLELIANKNLTLQSRMEIISLKSIRAKVLHYLEAFRKKDGGEIMVPYNREEMAAYLCIERSALSHELTKMKSDGLIEYKKNRFLLK